ncbi:hypothetical protein BG005_006208 [Podila minutissima]|nr:hypothetical protein BG005_006208 [Podila minutissima]
MKIKSVASFAALAFATLASTSLAVPAPTGTSSDGALKQPNPPMDATDASHKLWNWNPIDVGECRQEEDSLKIYQDGRLECQAVIWRSRVSTTNIWRSTFQFKNSTGQVASVAGSYDSPMMWEALAHYDWNIKVRYEANKYDQIAAVTQWLSC